MTTKKNEPIHQNGDRLNISKQEVYLSKCMNQNMDFLITFLACKSVGENQANSVTKKYMSQIIHDECQARKLILRKPSTLYLYLSRLPSKKKI